MHLRNTAKVKTTYWSRIPVVKESMEVNMRQQKYVKTMNNSKCQIAAIILLLMTGILSEHTARELNCCIYDTVDSYFVNETYCRQMLTSPLTLFTNYSDGFDGFYLLHYNGKEGKLELCDRNSEICRFNVIEKDGIKYAYTLDGIETYKISFPQNALLLYPTDETRDCMWVRYLPTNMLNDMIWKQKDKLGIVNMLLFATYLKEHYNYDIIKKLNLQFPYTLDRHLVWGSFILIQSNNSKHIWILDGDVYAIRLYKYLNLCDLMLSGRTLPESKNGNLHLIKTFKFKRSTKPAFRISLINDNNKLAVDAGNVVYHINPAYEKIITGEMRDVLSCNEIEKYVYPVLQCNGDMSSLVLLDYMNRRISYERKYEKHDSLISFQNKNGCLMFSYVDDTLLLHEQTCDSAFKVDVCGYSKYIISPLINDDIWEHSDPIGIINLKIIANYFNIRYRFNLIRKLHLKYPYTFHTYTGLNNLNIITSNQWDSKNVWSVELDEGSIKLYKCKISISDSLIESKKLKFVLK